MSERGKVEGPEVPDLNGLSTAQIAVKIGDLAVDLPAPISLQAAVGMNQHTITLLAATIDRLGKRQSDISELLTIAKSAHEMTRKIDRLTKRLMAEEDPDGA